MPEQKVVLVTGASQRLGLTLCREFYTEAKVIAVTRKGSDDLRKLASEHVEILEVDYENSESIHNLVQAITTRYSKIDVLINNASYFDKDVNHMTDHAALFNRVFNVHVVFPYTLINGLQPLLENSNDACVINLTDIYVDNPNPDFGIYCSSKAALENLSISLAKKLAPKIRVNTLRPGPVEFLPSHTEAAKEQVQNETMLEVGPGFEPLVKAVRYLIDNDFVTSTSTIVDGGRSFGKR